MPATVDHICPVEQSQVGAGLRVSDTFGWSPHVAVDKYWGEIENHDGRVIRRRENPYDPIEYLEPYETVEAPGNLLLAQGAEDLWNALSGGSITGGAYNATNATLCVSDGNPTATGASCTFTNGSTTVSCSTTSGPLVGDYISLNSDGNWYAVTAITTNTSFTIATAYTGVTGTGASSYVQQEYVANTALPFTQGSSLGGGISGVSNSTTCVVTTASAHGLIPGQVVTIAGVTGATGANGTWVVNSVPTTATFSVILGSTPGAYSANGTVVLNNLFQQLVNTTPGLSVVVGSGITGVSNSATTTVTTTAAHGLVAGQMVTIASVVGATGANGTWKIASVPTTNTFTIALRSAPGAYSSGGTVTLINILQCVATFGPANANFSWNAWGVSNCAGAQSGAHLLNEKVIALGKKVSSASWVLTATLSLS